MEHTLAAGGVTSLKVKESDEIEVSENFEIWEDPLLKLCANRLTKTFLNILGMSICFIPLVVKEVISFVKLEVKKN